MTDPYKFYIFAREPSSACILHVKPLERHFKGCIIDQLDFRIQVKRLFYRNYRGMFLKIKIVGEEVTDCVLYL